MYKKIINLQKNGVYKIIIICWVDLLFVNYSTSPCSSYLQDFYNLCLWVFYTFLMLIGK